MLPTEQERKILLIGNENEFLIKGVQNVMQNNGYDVLIVPPNINSVNAFSKSRKVWLLFVESAEDIKDLLVYLKDTVYDKRMQIALVGERLEIQEAAKHLHRENVGKMFERPIDVKSISEGLEELYTAAEEKSGKRRILVIDDDPEYLRRTQQVLHNHYKVYIANSGASVLMLLAKHKVDLILLDYMMPVLDGPKILETLKNEPDTANIPVIFLTGMTDARSVTKGMLLGAENYISKTTAAKDLAAMVADFFAKKDWERSEAY